jgi:anti-sigma regulatory factor (Ser/Thr protein kinase)
MQLPGVVRTGVALTQGGGRRLRFTTNERVSTGVVDWCEVDAYDDVPLNKTVRTGQHVAGTLADLSARYPEYVGRQAPHTSAITTVALSAHGRILGGVVLYYGAPQPFDEAQLDTLQALGRELGDALDAVRRGRSALTRRLDEEPLPAGAVAAIHSVAADPRAVRAARQFVRHTLTDWQVDPDTMGAAVLCVSELVTNAIIHSDTGCEVRLLLRGSVLTATVRDAGTAAPRPDSSPEDLLAIRGRGLQLVNALSVRWGSAADEFGTTVWCELDVA